MPDLSTFQAECRRYSEIIAQAITTPSTFSPTTETAQAIQVERGILYARTLLDPRTADLSEAERLIELAGSDRLASLAVVDRGDHHRPVYQPLLIYSWLQTFRLVYETLSPGNFGRWEEGVRPWCDMLESELTSIDWPSDGMPAARGASAAETVWMALALSVAGKVFVRDAWTDLASDTFGKLLRGPDRSTFLLASSTDNPETLWYHELIILHAAASYAVQAEDRTVAAAVARATEFHLQETQPDHATAQPWGLFAFIWNAATHPLADQLLHSVSLSLYAGRGQGRGSASQDAAGFENAESKNPLPAPLPGYREREEGQDGVTLMLLADALYCLRLFQK